MSVPKSLTAGKELDSPKEDLRNAERVEQYRVSQEAVYIPEGLRWNYIPFCEITDTEYSHRNITAGKCVAVTEQRPVLILKTVKESFSLPFEKQSSMEKVLAAMQRKQK